MKVGLFFGSFNPIHLGHLIIAETMLSKTELDYIWFVVSPQNPFKVKKNLLDKYDRFHLVELATEGNDRLKASNIEFSLPKPSYTVHTLSYLKEKYNHDFALLMGSDNLLTLHKWKNSSVIIDNYPLYVYERPGSPSVNCDINHIKVEAPLMYVSSTYIRKSIKNGHSIRYLVPDSVDNYINNMNLYKTL